MFWPTFPMSSLNCSACYGTSPDAHPPLLQPFSLSAYRFLPKIHFSDVLSARESLEASVPVPVCPEYTGADGAYRGSAASKGNRRKKQPSHIAFKLCFTPLSYDFYLFLQGVWYFPWKGLMKNIVLVLLLKEQPFSDWFQLATEQSSPCRWYTRRSDQKWLFNVQPPHFPQEKRGKQLGKIRHLSTHLTCMKKPIPSRKAPVYLAVVISPVKNAASICKAKKTQRKFSRFSPNAFPDGRLS